FAAANLLDVKRTTFDRNVADAGAGGVAEDGPGGTGGDAYGGAVDARFGTLNLEASPLVANRALAGDGGNVYEGRAGDGGNAFGGAVYTAGNVTARLTGTLGVAGATSAAPKVSASGPVLANAALGGTGGY